MSRACLENYSRPWLQHVSGTLLHLGMQPREPLAYAPWAERNVRRDLELARKYLGSKRYAQADKCYAGAIVHDPADSNLAVAAIMEYAQFTQQHPQWLEDNSEKTEGLYQRVLLLDRDHAEAATRRSALLPRVDREDNLQLQELYTLADQYLRSLERPPGEKEANVKQASITGAYAQHIYNTLALENNTMTLDEVQTAIAGGRIPGRSHSEHSEVVGMHKALTYLKVTDLETRPITLEVVLELHRRVLGDHPTNGRYAGILRDCRVVVGSFEAPVAEDQVPGEMQKFIEWWNEEAAAFRMDPCELACMAHYRFLYIHPFRDGNGRVGRLLLNLALSKANLPWAIVAAHSKTDYNKSLEAAQRGDYRYYQRFMLGQMMASNAGPA